MAFTGKKCGKPSKKPSLEQLEKDYETLSLTEIAAKYGVAYGTVNGWLVQARKLMSPNVSEELEGQMTFEELKTGTGG